MRQSLLSNFSSQSLVDSKQFIQSILKQFAEIKVIGAQENEEIDSLEHVALFHRDKLLTCSPSWDAKIHETDQVFLQL